MIIEVRIRKKLLYLLGLVFAISLVLCIRAPFGIYKENLPPTEANEATVTFQEPLPDNYQAETILYINDSHIIHIKQSDVDLMNRMYEVYRNEFSLCFAYDYQNDSYYIDRTLMMNSTINQVQTICYVGDVLMIHSHPAGTCKFSDADEQSLMSSTHKYQGLICGVDKFMFQDKMLELQRYEVIDG